MLIIFIFDYLETFFDVFYLSFYFVLGEESSARDIPHPMDVMECSRMVLSSPDWGAHGRNEYWRTLLHNLMLTSIQLPDVAINVPLGRKTLVEKPG